MENTSLREHKFCRDLRCGRFATWKQWNNFQGKECGLLRYISLEKRNGFGWYWSFIFGANLPIPTGRNISKGRQISVSSTVSHPEGKGPPSISPVLSRGQRSPAAGAHPMEKEDHVTSLFDSLLNLFMYMQTVQVLKLNCI